MPTIKIIGMCILAAVVYGVVHDQVTVRVCVEYFTVGHPPVFGTDDPTLLGLGWGALATWWVGLILGLLLAAAARRGKRPQRDPASLLRPIVLLMAVTGLCALGSGIAGWFFAQSGSVFLLEPLASRVPAERHAAFIADLWAHLASYAAGFLGGIIVIIGVWRSRRAAATNAAG
jgi:hypothetical protein